jgi:hypothetical protein
MKLAKWKIALIVGLLIGVVGSSVIFYVLAQSIMLQTLTLSGGAYPGAVLYTFIKENGSFYGKNMWGSIVNASTDPGQLISSVMPSLAATSDHGSISGTILLSGMGYSDPWIFQTPLVIPNGVSGLTFKNNGAVLEPCANYNYNSLIDLQPTNGHVYFDGLEMFGNKQINAGRTIYGIYEENSTNPPSYDTEIWDSDIVNFTGDGIFIADCEYSNRIFNNNIEMNGGCGIRGTLLQASTIDKNRIYYNDGDGINLTTVGGTYYYFIANEVITNNYIASNGVDGVRLFYGYSATVQGNHVLNNHGNGIDLNSFHHASISENFLDGSYWHGITIVSGTYETIADNIIDGSGYSYNNYYDGIYMVGNVGYPCGYSTLEGNVISSVGYANQVHCGIYIDYYVTYTLLSADETWGSNYMGMLVLNSTNHISNCYNETNYIASEAGQ